MPALSCWLPRVRNGPRPGRARTTPLPTRLQAHPEPLGLYLQGLARAEAAAVLAQWRTGPHWFRPAYVEPGADVPDLADGAAPWDEALRAAHHADAVARSLVLDPGALRFDERLLYYLYLREPAELVPVRDRNAKYLYRYPIVEALEQAQEDSGAWLGALVRRNLLQPGTLVDRTRHCRQCASAHLHFLDVCPHCSTSRSARAPPCTASLAGTWRPRAISTATSASSARSATRTCATSASTTTGR